MIEEAQLIKKAQKGDPESFGALYDKYLAPIYRFVVLKVGDRHTAEDLTQQVFLSAWQNVRSYKHRGYPFSSWLYQIARNAVVDHYRTSRVQIELDSVQELAGAADLMGELETKIDLELAKVKIRQLPADYQDVIIMRFVEELSPSEVAAALGKSVGAVKVIQHRALNALKKLLEHGTEPKTIKDA